MDESELTMDEALKLFYEAREQLHTIENEIRKLRGQGLVGLSGVAFYSNLDSVFQDYISVAAQIKIRSNDLISLKKRLSQGYRSKFIGLKDQIDTDIAVVNSFRHYSCNSTDLKFVDKRPPPIVQPQSYINSHNETLKRNSKQPLFRKDWPKLTLYIVGLFGVCYIALSLLEFMERIL